MSLRPSAIVEERDRAGGLFVVIDDPGTEGVLLIPASFAHRQVLTREQYEAEGRFDVYPSQTSAPGEAAGQEDEWTDGDIGGLIEAVEHRLGDVEIDEESPGKRRRYTEIKKKLSHLLAGRQLQRELDGDC